MFRLEFGSIVLHFWATNITCLGGLNPSFAPFGAVWKLKMMFQEIAYKNGFGRPFSHVGGPPEPLFAIFIFLKKLFSKLFFQNRNWTFIFVQTFRFFFFLKKV
jgi:hypothetical protein